MMAKTILVLAGCLLLATTSLFAFYVYGELAEDSAVSVAPDLGEPSCCSEMACCRLLPKGGTSAGHAAAGPVALFVPTAPVAKVDCCAARVAIKPDPYAACCDLSSPTYGLEAVAGVTIVAAKP